MLRNYVKIAVRNLWRNKGYTFINVSGLMTGLACCLLISLYVLDELSYEQWNPKANRIYRINSDIRYGGSTSNMAVTSDPMGPTIAKDYPQIESFVRLQKPYSLVVKKGNESFVEEQVMYADSTLFNIFPFKILAGSAREALAANCIVVDETTAHKYFGSADGAIGKSLQLANTDNYRITAVIKDIPANTHFKASMFLSMANNARSKEQDWGSHNFNTYLLLKEGVDPLVFKKIFQDISANYVSPELKKVLGQSLADLAKQGSYLRYFEMPMRDIHLYSSRGAELGVNGNIQYVYIFSAVAFFILLIACINFMNLATAQSAGRAKEVGIRKVLGGERSTLISRFLTESALTVVIALVLALLAVVVFLPAFNTLADKELRITSLLSWRFIAVTAAIPLIVGLMAGSYPAFFLSGFQPIAVLKGMVRNKMSGGRLRSVLVVAQFTMSIVLLTGTVVVYWQLNYIQHKKLGFDREQVLIVKNTDVFTQQQAHTLKQELQSVPGITAVSFTAFLPVPSNRNDNPFYNKPGRQQADAIMMQNWRVDHDYVKTLGIELAEGRFFSTAFPSDSDGVVINESAAKQMGFSNPIGQRIYYYGGEDGAEGISSPIIGVVKDFHFESLRKSISPVAMFLTKAKHHTASSVSIRTTGGMDIMSLVGKVEHTWKTFAPDQPFTYNFLNQEFNNMYKAEQKIGKIAFLFAAIAIVIACLGLFGLVAFTVEQRTKEIGIRKVLGASVGSIVNLLSKDLMKLVLIALALATPIAWYLMQQWLQDYEYRVHIQWWMFIVAGGIAIIVALATISFQSVKAALLNPIKSLKSE